MEIKKAVITAAGRSQRALPLQTLVDRDGVPKTALAILVEEARSAGIEEIALMLAPGDHAAFAAAAGSHAPHLRFLEQTEPRGFGHAVLTAKEFTRDDSFLLFVGDHLYVTTGEVSCARQLVDVARAHHCAVSAVQATHESKLPYYGVVGGRRIPASAGLYDVTEVIEKPTPTDAEQRLIVPGLRTGHYLCFFGMHVLSPTIFDLLGEDAAAGGSFALSPALARLAHRERYLAFEARGRRYDIGSRYGLLNAQLALGLHGRDQREILELIVDLLATRELDRPE
ncbi:MAG: NTP transferase domain-containing protein [Verrucomicrobiales bacterium]|nr:NTP transferase domain-containing protein [Verrucomicrobiales bacterium]